MNNDRFKFRVLDKSTKQYINEEKFLLPNGDLGFFIRSMGYPHYRIFNNQEMFTIEQCTGILDKNGKLIYEGDIIRFDQKLFEDESYKVVWDKRQEKFTCIGIASHSEYITWYTRFENMQSNVCEVVNNVNAWERYR